MLIHKHICYISDTTNVEKFISIEICLLWTCTNKCLIQNWHEWLATLLYRPSFSHIRDVLLCGNKLVKSNLFNLCFSNNTFIHLSQKRFSKSKTIYHVSVFHRLWQAIHGGQAVKNMIRLFLLTAIARLFAPFDSCYWWKNEQ